MCYKAETDLRLDNHTFSLYSVRINQLLDTICVCLCVFLLDSHFTSELRRWCSCCHSLCHHADREQSQWITEVGVIRSLQCCFCFGPLVEHIDTSSHRVGGLYQQTAATATTLKEPELMVFLQQNFILKTNLKRNSHKQESPFCQSETFDGPSSSQLPPSPAGFDKVIWLHPFVI